MNNFILRQKGNKEGDVHPFNMHPKSLSGLTIFFILGILAIVGFAIYAFTKIIMSKFETYKTVDELKNSDAALSMFNHELYNNFTTIEHIDKAMIPQNNFNCGESIEKDACVFDNFIKAATTCLNSQNCKGIFFKQNSDRNIVWALSTSLAVQDGSGPLLVLKRK